MFWDGDLRSKRQVEDLKYEPVPNFTLNPSPHRGI